jgi:hypothetical protein
MVKYLTVAMALFVSLGFPAASAQTGLLTHEASVVQDVLGAKLSKRVTNDSRWRESFAAALHRYCESVIVQIPANTPQEDRWVGDEIRNLSANSNVDPDNPTSFEQRAARVLNSVEFARQSLRDFFSQCSSIAKSLMETTGKPRAAEVLLWVRLSRIFSIREEVWRLAEIVGLLSPDRCRRLQSATFADIAKGRAVERDKNDLCSWDYIHNVIMDHTVIPLLELPGP